jgi:ketosteroid isomerase-like protein
MTKADVQRWLDAYVSAWSSYDAAEIAALFTDDASYRYDPFGDPLIGGAAIAADWLSDRDEPASWEAEYHPFAVDGDHAVATGETRYVEGNRRYANVYLLEFAADGRCRSFTEWYLLERSDSSTG